MVELAEVGEDAPLVQLLALHHVLDVQERGDVKLFLSNTECELTVAEKYFEHE